MPDYIYLLENRLSADQQNALRQLREAAREAGMILFLTGDAVRDLTSGHSVRDLEVVVHGNALKLKKTIEKLGGQAWGEDEASRSLYLCFPGTVRVDVVGAHRVEYPKPGKPVYHHASIQEDLRRRDFTVNAMAISLNEGSFGLLMDPMNGAADIEARTLRLVSNYGFLEEPSLLIRATRYRARLGWELDPKTQTRYDNAKGEEVIEFLSDQARSRELEQIGHEEDGLKVIRALEEEGWMQVLFPAWTSAKADEDKLVALHALSVQLLMQGVHADMSAAQMQLLTAKLSAKDLTGLKKLMLRPGFVEEWNNLDAMATGFAKVLLAKENLIPSASYKLFTSYDPEAVLWLGFTSKEKNVQERFNLFLKTWPEVRQRIPYALMLEMRITPELSAYNDIVKSVFLELIDGRLTATDEIRAFLEPYSPPAPPPQVTIKKPRAKRGAEAKLKEHSYDDEDEDSDDLLDDEDLDDIGGDDDEIDLEMSIPKIGLGADLAEDGDAEEDEAEPPEPEPIPAKPAAKHPAKSKPSADVPAAAPAPERPAEPITVASASKAKPKQDSKTGSTPAKSSPPPAKPVSAAVSSKAAPVAVAGIKGAKPVAAAAKPASTASAKVPVKSSAKLPAKASAKAAPGKPVPAKGKPAPAKAAKAAPTKASKPSAKKPASKAAKKR
jgi:tRNA nucleotidyltransferase/poly(A) polymerase